MNNLKKPYTKPYTNSYTTSYILNSNEVFKNMNVSNVSNMNSQVNDDIVYNNIQNGGMMCDHKIRSNINSKLCERLKDESLSVIAPFQYNNVVDTEYYLLHGEHSRCSKYWKDRHSKS